MSKEKKAPQPMSRVEEVINLLRYGGLNLQPQSVVVALDDDILKLVRAIDKQLEAKGDKLELSQIRELVSAFNEKKQKEAEAAQKKQAEPVLEK